MAGSETKVTARLTSAAFDGAAMQVHTVHGREAISEAFVFDVEVLVPADSAFRAKNALGEAVRLAFSVDDVEVRHVNGIVAEAIDGDPAEEYSRHTFRIAPRIHRMTLRASCEVFLGKSVLDIALEKLGRAGLGSDDVSLRVAARQKPAEFRLQYDETDFAFVSRHLEHAGIAFFFDCSGDTDLLVLSDHGAGFPAAVGPRSVPYVPDQAASGSITSLRERSAMLSALHVVNDYAPGNPKLDLCGTATLDVPFGGEIIDFGTGHVSAPDGNHVAQMRAQSRQAIAEGFDGASTLCQLEAGRTVAVDDHPFVPADQPLLVVWVEHSLTQTTLAHSDAGAVLGYRNRFRAVDAARPYRPPLRTPRPRISGFAIAVTDVPRGDAVLDTAILDDEGRYTVHFLFDRADDAGRPVSSCRLRMMQPHAGANYGMHFPLKPGIEVAVGFHEGDPDKPFIAGAVPNALTPSPAMDKNPKIHHLQTMSGVSMKMRDA